ncbi:MAG: DegV family EDD domain-containing protein [Desulforhopalus sp.]|nr:DegV family EDD domain-containing protein [Desulforhopalus sp.]
MNALAGSYAAGYACLSAWADLLDRINVFPVADGDTGTNLRISLAPFRSPVEDRDSTRHLLARCATGNSGNIAAAFFQELCRAEDFSGLAAGAARGRDKAWQAIADPCPGTMLSVFDTLAAVLATHTEQTSLYPCLAKELQRAVRDTTKHLADLQNAGVVDSGALAMFVFFDGFFRHLTGQTGSARSIFDLFAGNLTIKDSFHQEVSASYCVDALLKVEEPITAGEIAENQAIKERLAKLGDSLVVIEDQSYLKIHIHTPDPCGLRGDLDRLGDVVSWSDEAMAKSHTQPATYSAKKPVLHIITDAAGSLPRDMARYYGISLLDSYIVAGDDCRPESLYTPKHLYALLREGRKVTTAQAGSFERQQHYQSICQQFGDSLYLAVGSAFTGNYAAAIAWKAGHVLGERLTVIDTGAASGRLALIALLTARKAYLAETPGELIAYAERMTEQCAEYVFINELKYLVAGGRVSRTSGIFADLLHMKPIISPAKSGVRKVGVVRSSKGQLAFALHRLRQLPGRTDHSSTATILLQYSDNEDWVAGRVQQQVREAMPDAEILLCPISLTSGVHMGPGTWSMAVVSPQAQLPEDGHSAN